MSNRKNAYTEVYTILQDLEEEAYNKIPPEIIQELEKNKNNDYKFRLDEEQELKGQLMLPETKAILFNIFRDYLATPEQKQKIIKLQNEERRKNELKKKEKYSSDVFANKQNAQKTNVQLDESINQKQNQQESTQMNKKQQIQQNELYQETDWKQNEKKQIYKQKSIQETGIKPYKQNTFQKIIIKIKQWIKR